MNAKSVQESLMSCELTKWAQMIVTGESVSVAQAKDIIFRTDHFLTNPSEYSGGNACDFNEHYRVRSGLEEFRTSCDKDGRYWPTLHNLLRNMLECVNVYFVVNDWASCSFVYGPHGWCNPDGRILFRDNVGKYATVEYVLKEWAELAKAFPYLDLNVTLINDEGDGDPVVNIRVQNGGAVLMDPDLSVHVGKIEERSEADLEGLFTGGVQRELGLPEDWYEEFAGRVRSALVELKFVRA